MAGESVLAPIASDAAGCVGHDDCILRMKLPCQLGQSEDVIGGHGKRGHG